MPIKILLFTLLLCLLPIFQAFPWGAVEYWSPTHQAILVEAYKQLKKDPAFLESGFLPLDNILAHEGVTALSANGIGVGPGPDSVDDASLYSFHYYNPETGQGSAPSAVKGFYKQLLGVNQSKKNKAAAWSAHFLADMSVPYHVIGMTRDSAVSSIREGITDLSEDITGPLFLYNRIGEDLQPPIGWGGKRDFQLATANYLKDHSGGVADWYDPWYSNFDNRLTNYTPQGYARDARAEAWFSSHVLWEKDAHTFFSPDNYPDSTSLYNSIWRNAAIDPSSPFNKYNIARAQAGQSATFTQAAARHTRDYIRDIYLNPEVGIYNAILNVATLWRSSITGLRPKIVVWSDRSNDPDEYGLECRVKNIAYASVYNVQAKLSVYNNQKLLSSGSTIKSVGDIGSGQTASVKFWTHLPPGRDYVMTMEIVADYNIPDLQYATVTGTFRTQPAKRETEETVTETGTNSQTAGNGGSSSGIKCQMSVHPADRFKYLNMDKRANSGIFSDVAVYKGEYEVCSYHDDGALGLQTPFKNGKTHGLVYGTFQELPHNVSYEKPYINGKLHGTVKLYAEWPGHHYLEKERSYVNGKLHGDSIFFYPTGKVERKEVFSNGKKTKRMSWLEKGKLTECWQYFSDGTQKSCK